MLKLLDLFISLSGPLARFLNLILDAVERNPTINAEWQKFRERVFYRYSIPANATKDALQIEDQIQNRLREGSFGKYEESGPNNG